MVVSSIVAYHRPTSVEDAWGLIRDTGGAVRLLGGGTDLVTNCPPEVRELVDLQLLPLRSVERAADGTLTIGAMTTFTELLEHPVSAAHAAGVLRDVLIHVGSPLHRNSATVGGHIARGRMSDLVPVLLALDATVAWYDGAHRELTLEGYYLAERPAGLLLEVRLPALTRRSAGGFVRFARTAFDHALVNAACRLDLDEGTGSVVTAARVVVGETATLGHRVPASERRLVGAPLDADTIAGAVAAVADTVVTSGDWVASAEYRHHLTAVATRRCLEVAAARLEGAAP